MDEKASPEKVWLIQDGKAHPWASTKAFWEGEPKCLGQYIRADAADATITALRDRVAEVERERDEALEQRNMTLSEMSGEMARATAAEAAIARLRDDVGESLSELIAAMDRYQQDVDTDAPRKHRAMMARARAALRALQESDNG